MRATVAHLLALRRPCTELNRATEEGGDWFVIDVDLPEDTFKVQFVVVASNGTVDNNCARDFTLRLLDAPTEEEVLAKRIKEFERAEKERQEVFSNTSCHSSSKQAALW